MAFSSLLSFAKVLFAISLTTYITLKKKFFDHIPLRASDDPSNQMCDFAYINSYKIGKDWREPVGICIWKERMHAYVGNRWVDDKCNEVYEAYYTDDACTEEMISLGSESKITAGTPNYCNTKKICNAWAIYWSFSGGTFPKHFEKTSFGSVNDCFKFEGKWFPLVEEAMMQQSSLENQGGSTVNQGSGQVNQGSGQANQGGGQVNQGSGQANQGGSTVAQGGNAALTSPESLWAKISVCDEDGELEFQWYEDNQCDLPLRSHLNFWPTVLRNGNSFMSNTVKVDIVDIKCYPSKLYEKLLVQGKSP